MPQAQGAAAVTPGPDRCDGTEGAAVVRYAALGDSITAGLGDGVSMGARRLPASVRGFAGILAASLGPPDRVSYVNLAETGATAADVRLTQLPVALAWRPTLASVVVGMNDVLDLRFDADRSGAEVERCVRQLRAAGSLVLTVRFADPAPLFRMPRILRRLLSRRLELLNERVAATAAGDAGVLVLDLANWSETYHRCCWDVDRVHPGSWGHALLARRFAELVLAAGAEVGRGSGTAAFETHPRAGSSLGSPPISLPAVPPMTAGPGTLRHAWWLARVGLPWAAARGGAAVPAGVANMIFARRPRPWPRGA
ncbi:MAG: SGNH/GDSL hydrolase family protein [Frankia sp.]